MDQLHLGQLAPPEQKFCPYSAVAKYPFRYFQGTSDDRKHMAAKFWDGGQLKEHGWNIYYIRPLNEGQKPLLLIPKIEVEAFFQKVEVESGIRAPFPNETNNPGFEIAFQEPGDPRPRYLARLTGETTIIDLQNLIPTEDTTSEKPLDLDHESLSSLHQRIEFAYLAGRNDTQAQRDKKKKNRLEQKARWCAQLRRTQGYLGVRPRNGSQESPNSDLPLLDVTKPAPYPFNLNPIFICIDIEAYERDSKKLTEVGISTLDTLDIIKCTPGESGTNWTNLIRSRHFRVADYAHLVNRQFVHGCPDDFNKAFGTSEWISVNEIKKVVDSCFRAPYSAPGYYTPHPTKRRDCPRYGSKIDPLPISGNLPKRNVILVGHEVRSDIGYLKTVGYDISKLGNIVESVDTIDLWKACKHESNSLKLSRALYELGVDTYHLHNAGNDAAYTLQALIGITLSALDPSKRTSTSVPIDPSDDGAQEKMERRAEEEAEWADVEKEAGDGGHALSIADIEFDLAMGKGSRARDRPSKDVTGPKFVQSAGVSKASGPSNANKSESVHQQPAQAKNSRPKGKPENLPQQMQKRLVIFDDEDYGF